MGLVEEPPKQRGEPSAGTVRGIVAQLAHGFAAYAGIGRPLDLHQHRHAIDQRHLCGPKSMRRKQAAGRYVSYLPIPVFAAYATPADVVCEFHECPVAIPDLYVTDQVEVSAHAPTD
ncbi:hypothetical protein [Streptomyces gilvosporeus]|uniref:hypothetical protein n=1 Tax=Streptomyces gilvosporeus TaxID=553510 RepID=UPI00131B5B57|nr:hypothetical protein [Streptomyces gilvosporeus]